MDNHQQPVCFAQRLLSYLICALLAGQPLLPAFAAPTPANGATKIDQAANGVPVVNIATPNGAGISHNQYQDYNVGHEGLILNNATGQLNPTQLGGIIQNNPNLKAGQEARGIINEVTGANRSQLQGYTEVAGKAANVMVANPYGITCNGCGFINTPNATLTTGKPVFDANGNLQSLDVTKGSITIEGQGLNASQSDALSIISRATEINADIHARDLTVIAGANRVTADGRATVIAGEGAAPVVAVDTGALGGMYANRIRLVSSDKGVGVNLGNLNARQGDITLDANGKLTVKNSLASGSLTAKGESVALSGEHKTSGDIKVSGQEIALNSGTFVSDNNIVLNSNGKLSLSSATLTAGNNLSLNAQDVTQDGSSRADAARDITANVTGTMDNQGLMVAGNNVALNSGALTNRGTITANGAAQLIASTLNNSGTVQSQKNMAISASALTNGGQMLSGGELDLTTQTLEQNGTLSVKGRANINATNTLNNSANGKILSDDALTVIAGNIQQNGTLSGKNALTVKANSLTTVNGSLSTSQGNIALNAGDANLDGEVIAHGDLAVQAQRLTSQQNAQLQSDGQLTLNASDAALNGTHAARGNLAIRADNLEHGGKTNAAAININAGNVNNSGSLVAPELSLNSQTIVNTGLLQGDRALNLSAQRLDNQVGGYLYSAQNLAFNIPTFTNAGTLRTDSALTLSGTQLNNSGALIASALTLQGQSLTNSGLLQGTQALDLAVDNLNNLASGTVYSMQDFVLTVPTLTNAGLITSDARLTLNGNQLTNSGEINAAALALNSTQIDNLANGLLLSDGQLEINSNSLANAGSVAGDSLVINSKTLSNSGLLQGNSSLNIQADDLYTSTASRVLSGGNLTLNAGQLSTLGTIQGQNASVTATNWQSGGSLLGIDGLNVNVAQTLTNQGDVLSQGNTTLRAQTLDNSGSLLSAGDVTLAGAQFTNSGSVQGNTLALNQTQVENQAVIIGLTALNLDVQGLLNGGQLLSGGALNIRGDDINNSGTWQGQQILLNAQQLNNSGAIQSADALTLQLSGNLTSTANSKITANGSAAIQALDLTNNGQWIAKNLSINARSLNNNGDISGVEGLNVVLTGAFNQQQGKTLLTGGTLNLSAASVENAGQIQGADLQLNSATVNNSGRVQANDSLALSGNMTNSAAGIILSQNTLNITAPALVNDGLIQGGGTTRIDATSSARNDGKLLSGGEFTLNSADFTNNNWLQATTLLLNASTLTNGGTLLADSATLTGNAFSNTGTAQGGNLLVNYQQLTNSGTLFGTTSLTVNADQVNHMAAGTLFSGGNLVLNSNGFDALGQVVALGNLTLKLNNAFTGKNVIAAGNVLDITSDGAITNQNVMQGQAVNLSAGDVLTNNGQITTGSSSTLSGSQIAMNAAGSLQAGGDVALNSRGNIMVDGFVGTASSLTLNAAGSILNTALLYAGNNMYLLANSIKNTRGDILAGNSLWMQRDLAGNANTEVVNTSGNIETVNGDITIKTGHLLNEREGLQVTREEHNRFDEYDWLTEVRADIPFEFLPHDIYTFETVSTRQQSGGTDQTYWTTVKYYGVALKGYETINIPVIVSTVGAQSSGPAGRISAGRDLWLNATTLDNNASDILATRNASLSGNVLNNQSWQSGTETEYWEYKFVPVRHSSESEVEYKTPTVNGRLDGDEPYSWFYNSYAKAVDENHRYISYEFTGQHHTELSEGSALYRAVIQAGGNVTANFTSDISNTTTTANTGGISNTITVPTLNTLSQQTIDGGVTQQDLASADTAEINSPQWRDNLADAVAQISGGSSLNGQTGSSVDTSLYPLPSGNNGYFVTSTDPNSPYLITTNPKLDGLGELDQSLFGDLYALMGTQPGAAPRETNAAYIDQNKFLGSSYFLERLNLHPEYDYRFLGDAAFDTRYVSNFMLNQTGSRYINGLGSDLEQMQYLMDNAANAQKSLGLTFGIALTSAQIAALDTSILWWEATQVNGQTVMVPKVYLSPKDVTVNSGSVISGNNVQLAGGNITNSGSTITAQNGLSLDSQNSISNLNAGLMQAGGALQLGALGDINNIGSTISGKTVQLESLGGSINNVTQTEQWQAGGTNKRGEFVSFSETVSGPVAGIIAQDGMSLVAGKDINITGANVAAGGDLLMLADGNINVTANQMTDSDSQSGFRGKDATSSESVTQQGSTISAGGNLGIQAGNDVTLEASSVSAGNNATLIAGNDLSLSAGQTSESNSRGKSETHSTDNARTTITAGGDLALAAGQDINSQAAGIAAEGDVAMQAGRDVNLMAAETTEGDSYKAKKKVEINESVRQDSTEIASGGNTTIVAGRDVNSQAAQVTASGDIGIGAGRDINLETATESDYHFEEETKTKKGFLNKTTTHTVEEDSATREAGSLLSGDNVTLAAGNNLLVQGSAVVGDGNVSLNAGNNIDIVAATNTDSTYRLEEKKKSGMFSGGGIGVTIGTAKSRYEMNDEGTTQSQSFSTVGSTGGDVSINAGGQAHIGGADIIAGKDLSITGDSVLIEPGRDARTHDESFEQKQSGLTIALSGAAGSAVTTAQSVSNESDDRLAALKIAQATMSGAQAGQALALDAAKGTDPTNTGTIGISASLGTQSSKSTSHSEQNTATGSTLTAGDNVSITATGGDITAIGSQIKAGAYVTLDAADDINLISSQNTQLLEGDNKSSVGAIGIGIGVGSGGAGINISASGNASKGSESGNGTQHNETTIDAGNNVTIRSGDDTTIAGAQVSGNSVVADIGGDLSISSQQDSDRYDSQQKSISGGASFSFGTMTGSGSISVSKDKMNSDYDSVIEQSGIFAGDGGFDITVGGHTQLDGAMIASTGDASKNSLDTGTLGFSDIDNKAEYSTEHQGAGISTGGSIAENFIGNMANGLLVGAGGEGEAEGTTKSAVSDGTITIRDHENQQQDVADLSRDVEHANGSISPIFDKEKEQKRLEMVQTLGDIGSQAVDIARTAGQINAINAGKAELGYEPGKDATKEDWVEYNKKLAATESYKAEEQKWGTGGAIQQGISAATMALQGLAGGDVKAAVAGGASPYLAEAIKVAAGDNEAARVIAHAVVAGVVAEMQGKSAAAGGVGAGTTALIGEAIKNALYGDTPVDQLTEQQKQTLVGLGTLVAGFAGGLAGDSTASAMAGAQAGQNELSNNMASIGMLQQMMAQQTLNAAAMAEAGSSNPNDAAALALTKAVKEGLGASCLASDVCVLMAVVAAQNQGKAESDSAPNIGKDLTDAEKTELGGTGSGTPGGWGPEDEENARNGESSANPENRAEYEKYVDSLRASMEKPNVQDENLSNIIDDLYRPNAKIGSGSTADAVRYEIATGEKVGGRGHIEKAETYSKALQDWLNKNPQASTSDKAAAENVLKDMQNALKGK